MNKNKTRKAGKTSVHNLLAAMEQMLITKPQGWYNACVALNDNLTSYLRGNGPDVNWTNYPIARSWFSQNIYHMKQIAEVAPAN